MSSRRIGNYQITDYVGSGGFGSVFKAEDVTSPGRVVAIKELHKKHTRNALIKQRFFQEAVAMARLDHPNLPRLFTFGEDNGSYYLVMEFISGKLLSDDLLDNGVEKPERAALIISQVLDALGYAHKNGIIHRDLKPDNIMLVEAGSALKVKVLDFGIARMVGGESLTLAGEGFGTPAYMSPERIKGITSDDPRIDIYSAGIILYEMLAGKAPFDSKASDPSIYWYEMSRLHEKEAIPPLDSLGVSTELEGVVRRATAKRVEDRYANAEDMLNELARVGGLSPQTATAGTARLSLTTVPGGADVMVDDVLRGTSEAARGKMLIDGLAAGVHTVRVNKEGFNEYRINVVLEDGRQTDLQVPLAARATMAMLPTPETAAAGFDTLKFQPGDEKTALLVVESLPAGTTVFVGAQPVAHVGDDGCATMRLAPGSHEIRVATPGGATSSSMVTLSQSDRGSSQRITLPVAAAAVTAPTGRPPVVTPAPTASSKGKQIAAAIAVVLMLALGAAAYYVLSGSGRKPVPDEGAASQQIQSVTVPQPLAETPSSTEPSTAKTPNSNTQQLESELKRSEQERKKAEAMAAQAEADKKLAQKQATDAQQPQPSKSAPAAAPVPTPPTQPDTEPSPAAGQGCIAVIVTDRDGLPVPHVRVSLVEEGGLQMGGRTGDNGRWLRCGITVGHSVMATVFGPRGGVLGSRSATVTQGKSFLAIQIGRSIDEAPPLQPRRNKRGPYDRP